MEKKDITVKQAKALATGMKAKGMTVAAAIKAMKVAHNGGDAPEVQDAVYGVYKKSMKESADSLVDILAIASAKLVDDFGWTEDAAYNELTSLFSPDELQRRADSGEDVGDIADDLVHDIELAPDSEDDLEYEYGEDDPEDTHSIGG